MRRSPCGSYFLALHSKLKYLFDKVFLLRSGRTRRTLGAAACNCLHAVGSPMENSRDFICNVTSCSGEFWREFGEDGCWTLEMER